MEMGWEFEPIFQDLGWVLRYFSAVTAVPAAAAVAFGEYYAIPGVVAAALVTFAAGAAFRALGGEADDSDKVQNYVSAVSAWLAVAVFGSLPFVLVAWTVALSPPGLSTPPLVPTLAVFRSPVDALFEGMSGITGTGLSMAARASRLPATLQLWRSLLEWVGGIGIVVLTVAVLRGSEADPLAGYYEERTPVGQLPSEGPASPSTMTFVFAGLTVGAIAVLWLVGMPPWDAINVGMTAISTGGFAVTDHSVASYHSPAIEIALIPIMLAGAVPFPVVYLVVRGKLIELYVNLQARWLFVITAAGSVLTVAVLVLHGVYAAIPGAVRYGVFQFVSALTCTGLASTPNVGAWSSESLLVLSIAMGVGGAAGSTASGVKIIRALSLAKGTAFRVTDAFFPGQGMRFDEGSITTKHAATSYDKATVLSVLWFAFFAGGVFVLLSVFPGSTSLSTAVFDAASALSNVGLSAGLVGPGMPTVAKVALTFEMWVGRLEIIPVLVLVRGLLGRRDYNRVDQLPHGED